MVKIVSDFIYRIRNHGKIFLRYLTFKKLINFLKVEYAYKHKKQIVNGFPYTLSVILNNACQLSCPLCPISDDSSPRPDGNLQFQDYKRFIDELKDYAFEVGFNPLAEPFTHKNIFKLIEYAHDSRIGTRIHTNILAIDSEELATKVVTSGLDYLSVSIDGTSQEAYEKYRIGGDYQKALDNLKRLLIVKKKLNSQTPSIRWQFIVNKYNEHQIEEARQIAKDIGVEIYFQVLTPGLGITEKYSADQIEDFYNDWKPKNSKYVYDPTNACYDYACFWLWRGTILSYQSTIAPCCIANDPKTDFGNFGDITFKEIWNNKYYVSARANFSTTPVEVSFKTVCDTCNVFEKPHN